MGETASEASAESQLSAELKPESGQPKQGTQMDTAPRERPFSELYEEQVARVYGFIGYRVNGREQAEDLTQLVFEKALRAWNRFDPDRSSPSTWLLTIAKNVLIDHFRRRTETPLEEDVISGLIEGSDGGSVDHAISGELAAALSELGEREQTVLALRFGADLTGPEIGEMLALSTDNVHQIISRSLRKLRSSIGADRETD